MWSPEYQHPESCRAFDALEKTIGSGMQKVKQAKIEAGQAIREDTNILVSRIGKNTLPNVLDVADLTNNGSGTPDQKITVQYNVSNNQLLLVRSGRYGREIIKGLDDEDWTTYGDNVKEALEKAVHSAEYTERQ